MRREQWITKVQQHGRRWRFRVGVGTETTGSHSYETREEAEREQKKALKALSRVRAERAETTMEDALQEFRKYKVEEKRNSPGAVNTEIWRVTAFFGRNSGPLPRLGPEAAKALYVALRQRPTRTGKPPSDAEHRGSLQSAKRFGKWLVREGLWTSNPITEVEPTGRPKAGEESKPQLRLAEAQRWLDTAAEAGLLRRSQGGGRDCVPVAGRASQRDCIPPGSGR